jgi:hypothetical protein
MQKLDTKVLILIIALALVVDLNVFPVDIGLDVLPIVGNLDEGILTVLATLAGQEIMRRRQIA